MNSIWPALGLCVSAFVSLHAEDNQALKMGKQGAAAHGLAVSVEACFLMKEVAGVVRCVGMGWERWYLVTGLPDDLAKLGGDVQASLTAYWIDGKVEADTYRSLGLQTNAAIIDRWLARRDYDR